MYVCMYVSGSAESHAERDIDIAILSVCPSIARCVKNLKPTPCLAYGLLLSRAKDFDEIPKPCVM